MRIGRYFLSATLVSLVGSLAWNVLLNEKARTSVKQAGSQVSRLGMRVLDVYMEPHGTSREEERSAAESNRDWVEWQWEKIGY